MSRGVPQMWRRYSMYGSNTQHGNGQPSARNVNHSATALYAMNRFSGPIENGGADPTRLRTVRSCDGTPFAGLLAEKGVVPGIKVDTGAKDMALHPGETVTEGLDGLRERLAEYHELGARFAKWRAVITSAKGSRRTRVCTRMRTRWRVTQRSARRPDSCRSWSPRC